MSNPEVLMRRYVEAAANVIDDVFGNSYAMKNPRMTADIARLGFEIERNGIPFVAHEPALSVKTHCCTYCDQTTRCATCSCHR